MDDSEIILSTDESGGNRTGIIIFIVILVVVILIVIFYFAFRNTGVKEGGTCTTNGDCSSGLFCAGAGVCTRGIAGGTLGSFCATDNNCEVGLRCSNGQCAINNSTTVRSTISPPAPPASNFELGVTQNTITPPPGSSPISSFTNKILTLSNNTNMRLVVGDQTGCLSEWETCNSTLFNYNSGTNVLSVTINNSFNSVPVNMTGPILIDTDGTITIGTTLNFSQVVLATATIRNKTGIYMFDKFGNPFGRGICDFASNCGALAIFNNSTNYPNNPSNLNTAPAQILIQDF